MPKRTLFLISANKSRVGSLQWDPDDYDVRDGSADGPVIGRIYKKTFSPSGTPWFCSLMLFPAVPADRGEEETREAAMAALKEQWILRRGWEHPWIRRGAPYPLP